MWEGDFQLADSLLTLEYRMRFRYILQRTCISRVLQLRPFNLKIQDTEQIDDLSNCILNKCGIILANLF